MSWRIVQISSNSKLELKLNYLVVRNVDQIRKVHIPEIAVLIIESTAVSMTAAALCELSRNKIKIIFCDEKRLPYGELVPYHASHDSTDKLRIQMNWDEQTSDLIWAEIIRRKIKHQASVLEQFGFQDRANMLKEYCSEVLPGDRTNREGHSAKVYFNTLFGLEFSRREDNVINSALNYGYSIISSVIAREISIGGYDLRIGIFHDNGDNPLNLAYDLIEPYRPIIDRFVKEKQFDEFGPMQKSQIVDLLNQSVIMGGRRTLLINSLRTYVQSFFEAMKKQDVGELIDYEAEVHESDRVL